MLFIIKLKYHRSSLSVEECELLTKMSVLNQSGEEQVECPLCMEPLEVDDLNFFPCTCGYQICRFCWHRIRLDENGGLCPACRKAYSENPADFIPLSREQVAKLKAEKRQRDQQRKAKLTESRKHLASVRVVQRNLVFVVGLPPRLADAEILKRHEYFGKFGKIHKVVINQSTSYAGSQGPSASAYVTYMKSDDALRAIEAVNNVTIDNRIIKSSLGTTKYCSHFMKNQSCPKPDCMYLHEYGDPDASFTKEQMHAGKHQEYEKKLHDELLARTKSQNGSVSSIESKGQNSKAIKESSGASNTSSTLNSKDNSGTNKESWPQLDKDKKQEKEKGRKAKTKNASAESKNRDKSNGNNTSKSNGNESKIVQDKINTNPVSHSNSKIEAKESDSDSSLQISENSSPSPSPSSTQTPPLETSTPPTIIENNTVNYSSSVPTTGTQFANSSLSSKLSSSLIGDHLEDNSYFSSSGFSKLQNALDNLTDRKNKDELKIGEVEGSRVLGEMLQDDQNHQVLTDTLPAISTTEDWAAAFGFADQQLREHDLLQQKSPQRDVSNLSGFSSYGPLGNHQDDSFTKGVDNFSGFYELSKLQENLMDALANKTNGYSVRPHESNTPHPNYISNGLDHNMSKFFSDFHKYNSKEPPSPSPFQNGINGIHNPYHILPQKQLEEQLMNLGIKQNSFIGPQTTNYQNGVPTPSYSNGDSAVLNAGVNPLHNLYQKQQLISQQSQNSRNSEAELDFDPFQETQKALAEMMANEQNHKTSTSGRTNTQQMNGYVQNNQNGNHIPPPPPGFLQQQQQTHMNSFGSKILPFLNMSNSQQQQQQQQINNLPNGWSSNFNTQVQQQKNISNTDWKVLDPAILSSSRNSYQLAQMPPPPVRDPYNNPAMLGTQQIAQNGLMRTAFDYQQQSQHNNSPFSTFTQQIQPNYNTYTHINTQQNLSWFTNDLNSQISSPPGFRSSQATKQQEC